jgi:hypothetical protein
MDSKEETEKETKDKEEKNDVINVIFCLMSL